MSGSSQEWERLRRTARNIENDVERRLLGLSSPQDDLATSSKAIEALLEQLEQVIHDMENCQRMDHGSKPSMSAHMVERHRDILNDYAREYKKIRANRVSALQQDELLMSVRRDISAFQSEQSHAHDQRTREHEKIQNAKRATGEAISIAMSARDSLHSQRKMMGRTVHRLRAMAARFPIVNNLMGKITSKERRNQVVMSVVIGSCIFFLLWYSFG